MKNNTYASVGVDVDIEAKAAKILYQAAKKTWENRQGDLGEVVVPFDDFAGLSLSGLRICQKVLLYMVVQTEWRLKVS